MCLLQSSSAMVVAVAVAAMGPGHTGCANTSSRLAELQEARRLTSEIRVEFTRASEASHRAVMAQSEESAAGAAKESQRAMELVGRDIDRLRPVLRSMGDQESLELLDAFTKEFDQYRRLENELLPLASENTNLKGQRLSFGPANRAVDAFRTSLDAAVRANASHEACADQVLASKALAAVLEIQVLQARHVAESEDSAMTVIEKRMSASAASARAALDRLGRAGAPRRTSPFAAAGAALDRFMEINREIVALSRRNSNVRSTALSLGRERTVAATCEDQLHQLQEALARDQFTAKVTDADESFLSDYLRRRTSRERLAHGPVTFAGCVLQPISLTNGMSDIGTEPPEFLSSYADDVSSHRVG